MTHLRALLTKAQDPDSLTDREWAALKSLLRPKQAPSARACAAVSPGLTAGGGLKLAPRGGLKPDDSDLHRVEPF